jgi:hypothetical protein
VRWLVIVVGLSACNWAFGINETRQLDAPPVPFFDAPIDAPFVCPPIGTDPTFTNLIRPVIAQDCTNYVISATSSTAIALCTRNPGRAVMVGPVDQQLAIATGLADDSLHLYTDPKISPEGDEVFVNRTDTNATTPELAIFSRTGTTWSAGAPLPATFDQAGSVSAPTRGPNRHIIHRHSGVGAGAAMLLELVDNGDGTWTQVQTYAPTELDAILSRAPLRLSPDGLRLMFVGAPLAMQTARALMYADRSSINDRFSKARPLTSVSVDLMSNAYMNDDCSRIYMSSAQQIVFVQRQ